MTPSPVSLEQMIATLRRLAEEQPAYRETTIRDLIAAANELEKLTWSLL